MRSVAPRFSVSRTALPLAWSEYQRWLLMLAVGAVVYYAFGVFSLVFEQSVFSLYMMGLGSSVVILGLLFFHPRPYLLDPMLLLGANLYISFVLKVAFLSTNPDQLYYLLAGRDVSIFVNTVFTMSWSMALVFLAYYLTIGKAEIPTIKYDVRWSHVTLLWACLFCAVVSTFAAYLIVRELGLSALLENISAKRFNDLEGAGGRLESNLYWFFRLSLLSRVGLYLAVIYLLLCTKSQNKPIILILAALMLVVSIAVSLIFSARAQAVLLLVDIGLMAIAAGYKVRAKYVVPIFVMAYATLAYMAWARSGGVNDKSAIESLFGGRYLLDFSKTAHIMEHMDTRGGWLMGESLYGWLFVVVPDSIMPHKPMFLELGKWIGNNVFGYALSGVPPGIVGELYMNFGFVGLLLGMPAIGAVVGLAWKWYVRHWCHPAYLAIGAMFISRFVVILFNNDFGTFCIKMLMEGGPVMVAIYLCSRTLQVRSHTQAVRKFHPLQQRVAS